MIELTIKEALEQGYKYCGHDGQERLDTIDTDQESLKFWLEVEDVFLSSKEATSLILPSAEQLIEGLVEQNYDILAEDKDGDVRDFMLGYKDEFKAILDKMQEEGDMKNITASYEQTDIKLIAD